MRTIAAAALIAGAMSSAVKFSDCDGDYIYKSDLASTYTDPQVLEPPVHATMYLNGIMTKAGHIDNLKIDTYWEGTYLHETTATEDFTDAAGQPQPITFTVDIPVIAPSGSYNLNILVGGTEAGENKDKTIGCVKAAFTFWADIVLKMIYFPLFPSFH